MKRANNAHGGKRRNAVRPKKKQQLKDIYKKERRLKEEEARQIF